MSLVYKTLLTSNMLFDRRLQENCHPRSLKVAESSKSDFLYHHGGFLVVLQALFLDSFYLAVVEAVGNIGILSEKYLDSRNINALLSLDASILISHDQTAF